MSAIPVPCPATSAVTSPIPCPSSSIGQSNGLLIRRFWVRVPGGVHRKALVSPTGQGLPRSRRRYTASRRTACAGARVPGVYLDRVPAESCSMTRQGGARATDPPCGAGSSSRSSCWPAHGQSLVAHAPLQLQSSSQRRSRERDVAPRALNDSPRSHAATTCGTAGQVLAGIADHAAAPSQAPPLNRQHAAPGFSRAWAGLSPATCWEWFDLGEPQGSELLATLPWVARTAHDGPV